MEREGSMFEGGAKIKALVRAKAGRSLRIMLAMLFYYSGAFHLVRWARRSSGRSLTIVTYHRIAEGDVDEIRDSLPFLFVSRRTFEKQIAFLKKHYTLLNFKDLEGTTGSKPWAGDGLIITFDDGYADNLELAVPVLNKLGAPSTMFLPAGMISERRIPWWDEVYHGLWRLSAEDAENGDGAGGESLRELIRRFRENSSALFAELNGWDEDRVESLRDELRKVGATDENRLASVNRLLTWEELRGMTGSMEFGSHGHSHTPLDKMDTGRLREELLMSRKMIEEKTGAQVTSIAYPCGSYSRTVTEMAGEAGYDFAVTQEPGIARLEDAFSLKRINVWEGTARDLRGEFSTALFAMALGWPDFHPMGNRKKRDS